MRAIRNTIAYICRYRDSSTYTYVYVRVCVYIYTHTHTHTHTSPYQYLVKYQVTKVNIQFSLQSYHRTKNNLANHADRNFRKDEYSLPRLEFIAEACVNHPGLRSSESRISSGYSKRVKCTGTADHHRVIPLFSE